MSTKSTKDTKKMNVYFAELQQDIPSIPLPYMKYAHTHNDKKFFRAFCVFRGQI
jgi:hypothetical protein